MVAMPSDSITAEAVRLIEESEAIYRHTAERRKEAEDLVNKALGTDNAAAWDLINAFKPPK